MIDEEEVEIMLDGIIDNLTIMDCRCNDSTIVYEKQGLKNIKDMLNHYYNIKVKAINLKVM